MRRCLQRKFYLLPTPWTKAVFEFLLAKHTTEYGIVIHAFVVMSNHFHLMFTDPRGNYSAFFQAFHSELTRVLNAKRRRVGTMWERKSTHVSDFADFKTSLGQGGYIEINPAAAGLCAKAVNWEGATSAKYVVGETIKLYDPGIYNGNTSSLEFYYLTIVKPPGYEHLTDAQYETLRRNRLRDAELEARRKRRQDGRVVQTQSERAHLTYEDEPATKATFRAPIPTTIGGDPDKREAHRRRKSSFYRRHAEGRKRLAEVAKRGGKLPLFPAGTWQLWTLGIVQRDGGSGRAGPPYAA